MENDFSKTGSQKHMSYRLNTTAEPDFYKELLESENHAGYLGIAIKIGAGFYPNEPLDANINADLLDHQ